MTDGDARTIVAHSMYDRLKSMALLYPDTLPVVQEALVFTRIRALSDAIIDLYLVALAHDTDPKGQPS